MAAESAKVLVVDDDSSLTDLLVDTLAMIGYEAFPACSAEEGLKILSAEPIRLVIADINMPGMSGLEMLQEIKRRNRSLPVMLITGISTEDVRERAYQCGADSFLAKPFRIGKMEQEMDRLLSGIQRRRVLLVDDNEDFLSTSRERLEAANNQVYTADTIAAAREVLATHEIDLVLSDLKMPDGDGFQFLNELRAKFPDLSLLLISAYANDEIIERIESSGFTHFLAKPVDFSELEHVLASGEPTTV